MPIRADSVTATSTVCALRLTVRDLRPAPANTIGTYVSYCHGEPCVEATVRPSKSLMNQLGSNTIYTSPERFGLKFLTTDRYKCESGRFPLRNALTRNRQGDTREL